MKRPDYHFDDLSEAFDYCREANHPVRVWVRNILYKLYPSGSAIVLARRPIEISMDNDTLTAIIDRTSLTDRGGVFM